MKNESELEALTEFQVQKKKRSILSYIPRKVRIVFTILLLASAFIAALIVFKPQAKKVAIPETVVRVDVITVERSDYPVIVHANGTIEAETRGSIVAQVSGEIVEVGDNFITGGTFNKGDVLVQIDQRDFQGNLSQAQASLSQAESTYRQEQATTDQAELDWRRLGNTDPAPELVSRKPQMAAAKAQLDSAVAAYETAKLNLSRTTVTAPYDGRVIQRQAVLGQYVSLGTPLAEAFSTNRVEVRLPVSQQEFEQLGLNQFSSTDASSEKFSVVITSSVGLQEYTWNAEIDRTDSAFDLNTRQIDVIAEVSDPFSAKLDQPPLKIGQFVSARIQGETLDNVYVVPNKSVREGTYVYVVRDGVLVKLPLKITWQDDENSIIADGINDNELVVTTSLNSTLAGAKAKFNDDETEVPENNASPPIQSNSPENSEN